MNGDCQAIVGEEKCIRSARSNRSKYCNPHYRQNLAGKPFTHPVKRRPKGSTSERDSTGNKQCGRCDRWLPEDAFRPGQKTSDGLHGFCRDCERAWGRNAYHAAGGYRPEMGIFRKFKLREVTYQEMFSSQNGCCAACGESVAERLNVDHDHSCCNGSTTCGKCTRGLLCRKCNLALGLLEDNLDKVAGLFNYLRGWQNGQ